MKLLWRRRTNDGIDVDSIAARKEDQLILDHAMPGHDPIEGYSNRRLESAGGIHVVEQLLRAKAVCKQYGLVRGQAMDIKPGCDFDLAADRKKAWDAILTTS